MDNKLFNLTNNNQKKKAEKPKSNKLIEHRNKKIKKEENKSLDQMIDINEQAESFTQRQNEFSQKQEQLQIQLKGLIKPNSKTIKETIKILLQIYNSSKNTKNLLDQNDDFVYLQVNLTQFNQNVSIRPIQIKLSHPIYNEEPYRSKFCIICKDPQREFKDKIKNLNIPCIAKVIGYTKLLKKYPTFQDKRKLCNEFDLFFCDFRIYNLLHKPTGREFYQRKKIPFPIDCEAVPEYLKPKFLDNYESYLNDFANYSYIIINQGTSFTCKIGRVNMKRKQIRLNIEEALYQMLSLLFQNESQVNDQLDLLQSIHIKTFNSISLPIYNNISKEYLNSYYKILVTQQKVEQ